MTGVAEALVVSEVFPPAVGGSGELLKNVYSRLAEVPVTVWCDQLPAVGEPPAPTLTVSRSPMRTPEWGLMHPTGLGHHLSEAWRLRSFSRGRSLVIHCARALPEGVGAWLARCTGGAPYVCWAHGEDIASARSSRELRFLMARVLGGAAALLANSQNTASMLQAEGAPAAGIEVVYPGVDAVRFQPGVAGGAELRRRLAPSGELLVLEVGRLQRRKGHDTMLHALAALDRRAIPVRYVIVGDGQERTRLEALAKELRVSDVVMFEGAVAAEYLPAYYAAADVFVHPNRIEGEDIEGFGIVFLEAAAAALPVIAGRSGGVPEAVVDQETGLLVGGTDVDELRRAVVALARDPARRKAMGAAGRARAERQFTWEQAAARVLAIHQRVSIGHASLTDPTPR